MTLKTAPASASPSPLLPRLFAALFCVLAALLIVHTYTVFDQTWDEPATLGAGVEWYTHHTYNLDFIDPPLPRVATAALPYLLFHARSHDIDDPWKEGNAILAAGDYHHILTAARLGTLPFFLLAVWLVWLRTRDWLGEWPAAIAVLLFCTCEPILAHSGLSTTDVCFMAMFFLAMDRLWQFGHAPNLRNALLLGVGVGLALVSKLSALPYFFVVTAALFAWNLCFRRKVLSPKNWLPALYRWKLLLLSGAVCVLLVWSIYFFSVGPIFPNGSEDRQKAVAFLEHHHLPKSPVFAILDHVPAQNYFVGLRNARAKRLHLSGSYFLGNVNYTGNIFYFPIALLVKTPLPLLLFGMAGIIFGVIRRRRDQDLYPPFLFLCLVTPVVVGILGHVNQGLRHVLAIYPPLCMLGALAVTKLWQLHRTAQITVAALLAWQVGACLYASPDFLPYFNEAAATHADYFLVDSDLDWGQDLKRLAPLLRSLHADHIAISYNGTEELSHVDLPSWTPLQPNEQVSGWVVISEFNLKFHPDNYHWLTQYTPVARAGHSILIYHLP